MKKQLLLSILFFNVLSLFAQEKNPISSGEITIVTNETMKFKNLRFLDNQVVFFNIDTKSEFTYFLNSIKSIEDADGVSRYLKEGEVFPIKKSVPKLEWYGDNLPLRNEKKVYAQIIFKDGDTLNTYIKVIIPFNEIDKLSEVSLNRTVTAVIGGEKVKYGAEKIKSLRIADFYFRDRKFVLQSKRLVEVMYDGKIKWYRDYIKSIKDDVIRSYDFLVNDEMNTLVNLGFFNNRKKLKEITSSRPDLITFIDSMDVDDKNIMILMEKFETK